jgi:hypothetical protein
VRRKADGVDREQARDRSPIRPSHGFGIPRHDGTDRFHIPFGKAHWRLRSEYDGDSSIAVKLPGEPVVAQGWFVVLNALAYA